MFRSVLPHDLANAIAWETLTAAHGSFVYPELAGRHTGLLFSARLSQHEVLFYRLLEHQSTSDADMPFHEMFAPEVVALPSVATLVPSFSIVVQDLARFANHDIRRLALGAFPSLAVWALRDARDPRRLLLNLESWAHAFEEAQRSPRGVGAVEQLMRYFSFVVDGLGLRTFRARLAELAPSAETTALATIAERMLNQGCEEGRAQARVEVLVKLLALRGRRSHDDHRRRRPRHRRSPHRFERCAAVERRAAARGGFCGASPDRWLARAAWRAARVLATTVGGAARRSGRHDLRSSARGRRYRWVRHVRPRRERPTDLNRCDRRHDRVAHT